MSSPSFINGIIVGAGVVMALMSVGFLYYIAPIENQQGISSTEIRVAIFLGGIVAAVAMAYEFYSKKKEPTEDSDSHETISLDPEPNKLETKPEPEPEPPEEKTDEFKSDEPDKSESKDTKES